MTRATRVGCCVEKSGESYTFSHGDAGYLAADPSGFVFHQDKPGTYSIFVPNS